MVNISFKEFRDRQENKLASATFKRGIISQIYPNQRTADVIVVGNNQTILKGIQLSSAVPSTVKVGDRCRIDMFDETNTADMVVAYTYGNIPKRASSYTGATPLRIFGPNGTATSLSIPHNLGAVPNSVSLYPDMAGLPNGTVLEVILESVDEVNLNVKLVNNSTTSQSAPLRWWAYA